MNSKLRYTIIIWIGLSLLACNPDDKKEEPRPDTDLITGTYAPEDYPLNLPKWMPPLPATPGNTLTKAGVALGRMLFYDPILSRDSTQACATCHQQAKAFTDGLATSPGIRGQNGTRSAMPLVNLAYNTRGFFWDGRSVALEDQALLPIEDHLEMDDTWENVERKLRRHKDYPQQFRQAFGISRKTELTRDLVVKALSQFERTLISAYSRYDRVVWAKEDFPTDEEQRGLELFFIEYAGNIAHPG
ncbi:MAG TPA: cytochrome-c peroxidase, partial [Haliscomenobacter sp.]|uniref:cytochrome-c peroxidase n=1 Tax=Haliscomenobacter sp. TaxID=2717303 RepID=UPI002C9DA92C